jgi:hypothetical protein
MGGSSVDLDIRPQTQYTTEARLITIGGVVGFGNNGQVTHVRSTSC